ncbi:hypothetical protein BU17DRAFT_93374 [Hysterangium stoloniferum]|nr:hypothetical protein BU17DRAFT_93374 [Hysterangium stoloniferum]
MKRLFGSKPKTSKTSQVNPIPTPVPSDQFRPQPQHGQKPTSSADDWVLFNDDHLHDRSRSASFTSPPTSNLDHSPPVPPINGSMYQHPVANTTYNISPHHSSHSLVAPSTHSSGFPKKKNSPPLYGVGTILRSLDPDPVSELRGTMGSRSPSLESLPVSLSADRVRAEHEVERGRERERQRDWERQREWERKEQEKREREHERQRELEREKVQARLREKDKDVRREADRGRERDVDRERRKKEKKGLFGTSRDKDKGREGQAELTRMIGFLTATASGDWALVLHVCERASSSESMAKDASKALRREFKYAEPGAQLSAARLWAIMLRNCSDVFIAQASSKKFLDTLEEVLLSGSTSPVVRERLMDVLAAAAYAYPGNGKEGYRVLWRKVKPPNKPDEGIPFNVDEVMLNPSPVVPTPPVHSPGSIREQVIPPHEDMRRLFEECEIGRGNAQLLNEALTFARPEELYGPIIGEWYRKCRNSQDFIMAQIPWATVQADHSREEAQRNHSDDGRPVPTSKEEELFAALLAANQELLEAFRIYDDLQRLGVAEMEEKEVQERSRKEIKLDRTQIQFIGDDGSLHLETPPGPTTTVGGSAGPSRSPSPARSQNHHSLPPLPQPEQRPGQNQLALPRTVPYGPRPSRTPSPDSSLPSVLGHNASSSLGIDIKRLADLSFETGSNGRTSKRSSISPETPLVPSAKAMGKRRAMPGTEDVEERQSDDFADGRNSPFGADHSTDHDDDSTDGAENRWRRPVKYVYDAAADRARELRRDLGIPAPLSNSIHR